MVRNSGRGPDPDFFGQNGPFLVWIWSKSLDFDKMVSDVNVFKKRFIPKWKFVAKLMKEIQEFREWQATFSTLETRI